MLGPVVSTGSWEACPELLACPSGPVVGKPCDAGCPWGSPAVLAPPRAPLPPQARGACWVGAGRPAAAPVPAKGAAPRRGPAVRMLCPCREHVALQEMAEENLAFASYVRMLQHVPAWSGSSRGAATGAAREVLLLGGCHCCGYSPALGQPLLPPAPQPAPSHQDDEQEPLREQQQPALSPAAQLARGPASGEPCSRCRAWGWHPRRRGGESQDRHPPGQGRGGMLGAGHPHGAQGHPWLMGTQHTGRCQHSGNCMSSWSWRSQSPPHPG